MSVSKMNESDVNNGEDHVEYSDWDLQVAFNCKRHQERIEGINTITQSWRMKERMKTVSVALVMCLNIGVDPPDIVKTQPCARLECWIDPLAVGATKCLEAIGNSLQKQYERWQPRARYKQSLDPTVEEVKKLCTSLRRNAKEERVLFHYNGHGVPKPTTNGEIWVFNRVYTQYIPLSVYDLQTWMGAPSIYVYDCSNAGIIIDLFKQFADQHDKEHEQINNASRGSAPNYKNCIQLAACGPNEILPMHPDLPADMFTSCLTTPIKMALRWFVMQNSSRLNPIINLETIDKIPGQLSDRRTMLGELNWIFTAITDTIAWNTLPKDLFQKLFRQDLLVASLFRNFLLAERIMQSYNCHPVSWPSLPPTNQHPMWSAWDLALDLSLSNLPAVLVSEDNFRHSPFFQDQLTAFQVSLTKSTTSAVPTELPIVLQVLLSQVHRVRALELLGRFLDLGPSSVSLALSVGIFPYVLKLLQSSAKELRPLLVFIWAKILAVDPSCHVDLVRDDGHKYFLSILQDPSTSFRERTLCVFVLSCMVDQRGQEATLQGSLVSICLEQLTESPPLHRRWLAVCLGRLWNNYDKARWTGVRDQAHDKLYLLLRDPEPEVRAAAVYALGTFINSSTDRNEHSNSIDQGVALTLISIVGRDMSPLVRKELVVALQSMVLLFANPFLSVVLSDMRDGSQIVLASGDLHTPVTTVRHLNANGKSKSKNLEVGTSLKRVSSSSSISSSGSTTSLQSIPYGSVYHKMWHGLTLLENDPFPEVSALAKKVTDHITNQVCTWPLQTSPTRDEHHYVPRKGLLIRNSEHEGKSNSLPPSPSKRSGFLSDSPEADSPLSEKLMHRSHQSSKQKGPKFMKTLTESLCEDNVGADSRRSLVNSQFVEWSSRYFAEPMVHNIKESDKESSNFTHTQYRYLCNAELRKEAGEERKRLNHSKLESVFATMRFSHNPQHLTFHPYDSLMYVAHNDWIIMWDYMSASRVRNHYGIGSKVCCIELINAHQGGLVANGCDDGTVRIYDMAQSTPRLVTAWLAHPNTSKRAIHKGGLVMSWDQVRTEFLVGGEPRLVRLWDATQELCIADIPTDAEGSVTAISLDLHGLAAVGCGDGTVVLLDRRCPPSRARQLIYQNHSVRVVSVSLQQSTHSLITASSAGDVQLCDTRKTHSVLACNTSQGMKAMAVHQLANIFACGSGNQIGVYKCNGEPMNSIQCVNRDWFNYNSRPLGPVSYLAFHPYRPLLASAHSDNSVTIYSVENVKR